MPHLVNAFERHSCGETRLADERHYVEVLVLQIARGCDAQRGRDGCARVSRVEHVVLGFFSAQKTDQAVVLSNGRELVAPPGDDLVSVGLMTNVECNPVA